MLRVLVCSENDLRRELAPTVIGRQGIEVFRAARFEDVKLLASTLDPRAILVDRDLPGCREFIEALRREAATRERSVAVLARGAVQAVEGALLDAGANAVFRLPPDEGWDARLSRLLAVPGRHDARLPVRISLEGEPNEPAAILNLSVGGMLLATHRPLALGDDIAFRFRLPDGTIITGRGRVAREAPPTGCGVEFLELDEKARQAIRDFLRSARLG